MAAMNLATRALLLLVLSLEAVSLFAGDGQPAPKMSKETRIALERAFTAELVYIRTTFPMGTKGLTLKDGALSPSGGELDMLLTMSGPSVKPGDQARISEIEVKGNAIHFEINGGPVKHTKWYQRVTVGGNGGSTSPVNPNNPSANARGSYVDLVFDKYVPELDANQLKALLRPVFDFNAKSAEEAYLETIPPKAKEAIENHKVLVGMDRQMVLYAKGRAPKKVREKDGETEYEDWIYGEPPEDVDFVRFVGDEVVRVETMAVNGKKTLRTARELQIPRVEKPAPDIHPANAPTLRRPGEDAAPDSSQNPSNNANTPGPRMLTQLI